MNFTKGVKQKNQAIDKIIEIEKVDEAVATFVQGQLKQTLIKIVEINLTNSVERRNRVVDKIDRVQKVDCKYNI